MYMSIKRYDMRLVDSCNFLTMPLRNFPSTFGISELKKGYFPYKFDTLANASSSSGTKRPRTRGCWIY